jgi:hypothetical protein
MGIEFNQIDHHGDCNIPLLYDSDCNGCCVHQSELYEHFSIGLGSNWDIGVFETSIIIDGCA